MIKKLQVINFVTKGKTGYHNQKCFPKCKTFTHTYIHTFNPSNIHTVYKLFCSNNPLKEEATRGVIRLQISCIHSSRHSQQWYIPTKKQMFKIIFDIFLKNICLITIAFWIKKQVKCHTVLMCYFFKKNTLPKRDSNWQYKYQQHCTTRNVVNVPPIFHELI